MGQEHLALQAGGEVPIVLSPSYLYLSMLRITKESEYAFLLLSALLRETDTPQSAISLAQSTGIAAPMAGKVLKKLVKNNILRSSRGAYGGYQLSRRPEDISALDVVAALEGAPELVACVKADVRCVLAEICNISPFWLQLNEEICTLLRGHSLADMQRAEHHKFTSKGN